MINSKYLIEQCKHSAISVVELSRAARFPAPERIAYIGWIRHANLGDEAIFDAIRGTLQEFPFRHFAGLRKERALKALFRGSSDIGAGILGGGTLISNGWEHQLQALVKRGIPCHVFGTGVALSTESPHNTTVKDIKKWSQILKLTNTLFVRGPKSLRVLKEFGCENAEISGDPALLMSGLPCLNKPEQSVLGININIPTNITIENQRKLFGLLVAFSKKAISKGWKVKVFIVCAGDIPVANQFIKDLSLCNRDSIFECCDGKRYIHSVAACKAFVGVRLHSVVLAHCAQVPSMLLAYDGKCLDYMESMDMLDYSMTPKEWHDDIIWEKFSMMLLGHDSVVDKIVFKSQNYRERLLLVADKIRNELRQE